MKKPYSRILSNLVRMGCALVLTAALLLFLAGLRMSQRPEAPKLTLRTMETTQPVSLPAPPPPPQEVSPTPPTASPELPELAEMEWDPVAPTIPARKPQEMNLQLKTTHFSQMSEAPRATMTFSASELDSQPRLVNRPNVTFPAALQEKGVTEGKVVLEVLINSAGNVNVRRVLETSHTELTAMGESFASRAKFTPPKKDGRPVNALFRWPLLLKL